MLERQEERWQRDDVKQKAEEEFWEHARETGNKSR